MLMRHLVSDKLKQLPADVFQYHACWGLCHPVALRQSQQPVKRNGPSWARLAHVLSWYRGSPSIEGADMSGNFVMQLPGLELVSSSE